MSDIICLHLVKGQPAVIMALAKHVCENYKTLTELGTDRPKKEKEINKTENKQ